MPNIIGAPTLDDALSALSAAVAAFEERGERTLIFCEDKLTLLAERAVLDVQGGTMLTEVTTFARFLSGAKTDARLLSKQGSVMAIASLLAAREGELSCFKRGAARAVYETLAQLMASRVDEELLLRGAEEAGGTLAAKLKDLALLLAAYKDFLRTRGFVDESGYLALLPEALHGAGLQETNVIFFAFPSFTRQAQEGIGAAFDAAKSVSGIFLAGRQGLFTNAAARIFRLIAAERGVSVPAQLKSSLSEDAKRLSEGLYTPEKLTGEPVPTERVRAFTVLDEEEEFSAVAALIKKHVAEDKLRYSDFAVLVQDKESFPLVRRVFSAYHIPYFADEKRPFSEHPFAEFVLNVLLAAADGALPDEADAVASSLYFGDGGQYRNYLLKYGGYRGAVRREIKEGEAVKGFDREKLVSCRERMLSFLSLFPAKAKGARYAEGVNKLMELAEAERVTEELRENFTGAEHAFLDLSPLDGVLSEIACVSEGSLSLREFTSLLKSGFEALEISSPRLAGYRRHLGRGNFPTFRARSRHRARHRRSQRPCPRRAGAQSMLLRRKAVSFLPLAPRRRGERAGRNIPFGAKALFDAPDARTLSLRLFGAAARDTGDAAFEKCAKRARTRALCLACRLFRGAGRARLPLSARGAEAARRGGKAVFPRHGVAHPARNVFRLPV